MTDALQSRLRTLLLERAHRGAPATYKELADQLQLAPPQTIHRLTLLLEALMAEDVAAGRPLLAALCLSRRQQLPARGFFIAARELGAYHGEPEGAEAEAFHAAELRRALEFYARPRQDATPAQGTAGSGQQP